MAQRIGLLFATSGHSGVDRVVKNLLPEFGSTPHAYDLLLIPRHGPYVENVSSNIKVRRLPALGKDTVLPSVLWYMWRYRPDVMLSANHKLNRAVLQARSLLGLSTRVTIRMGTSISAQGESLAPKQRDALFNSMRRWYPLADAAVAPSHGVASDLMKIAGVLPDRMKVIPNPIVTKDFQALASQPLQHPWFRDGELPVVLGVGSLEPRKDFETLLRAFARVRAQQPCRLVILGEGKQRPRLLTLATQLQVQDDVDLPGYISNPDPYLKRAAVFVLSSRQEGAPAVIVESLACGTPVVSTDCPTGPAEALADGRLGALVPIGDDQAMAQAILTTLAAPPDPTLLIEGTQQNHVEVAAAAYLSAMGVQGKDEL